MDPSLAPEAAPGASLSSSAPFSFGPAAAAPPRPARNARAGSVNSASTCAFRSASTDRQMDSVPPGWVLLLLPAPDGGEKGWISGGEDTREKLAGPLAAEHVGSSGLPTVLNSVVNTVEV